MHTDYKDVLELPDGEEPIPENLFKHARDVIKCRWPEAEPHIMKDSKYAYKYAMYVIDGRWPEAEHFIMKDPEQAENYIENVIKPKLFIALGALSKVIGQKVNVFQMVKDWETTIDRLSKMVGECNESIKESNQAELYYKIDRS